MKKEFWYYADFESYEVWSIEWDDIYIKNLDGEKCFKSYSEAKNCLVEYYKDELDEVRFRLKKVKSLKKSDCVNLY